MRRFCTLAAFIFLVLCAKHPLFAQSGEIIGRITGESKALEFASILLYGEDSISSFTETLSDKKGSYRFRNVAQGSYRLKVSHLGYASRSLTVVVDSLQTLVKLDCDLQPTAGELDAVVLTAKRKEILVENNLPSTKSK